MHRIPLRHIMTETVITIHPDELVADAAQLMEDFELRRLPVVDDEGWLVGIVTDSDVLEAEAAGSPVHSYEPSDEAEWLTVSDIMTRDVVTIDAGATVGELAVALIANKVGGVPVVVEEGKPPLHLRLVGIVTDTDIFRMIAEAWQKEVSPA